MQWHNGPNRGFFNTIHRLQTIPHRLKTGTFDPKQLHEASSSNHEINVNVGNELIGYVVLIIAHHAEFDRTLWEDVCQPVPAKAVSSNIAAGGAGPPNGRSSRT